MRLKNTNFHFDPWEDEDCQTAFVEQNREDFDGWLAEKGLDSRFCDTTKYHLTYCEANESRYSEYGEAYKRDMIEDEADFQRDLNEDR